MSILDNIYSKAQSIKPSANQWMTTGDEKFKAIPAPADDPFQTQVRKAVELPVPAAIKASAWLSGQYNDLHNRFTKGLELAGKPGLTEDQKASYHHRLEQIAWQIWLLEAVARELIPCPPTMCANRVGGAPFWLSTQDRDRMVQGARDAHQAGQMAITLTTPAGRTYTLVPWKSTPAVAGELDPLDMAALARLGSLAGLDEMNLLDRIMKVPEVTTT